MIFNTLHRMVYPFLAIFARGLGVDLTTISYALTARSVVGTVGPFAAAVADRRGRRFGMLFGAVLFMLGAAVVVFWPSFPGSDHLAGTGDPRQVHLRPGHAGLPGRPGPL